MPKRVLHIAEAPGGVERYLVTLLTKMKKYPEYEFAKHKGYPTKKHLEIIEKYGILNEYRRTYKPVKNIIDKGINKTPRE